MPKPVLIKDDKAYCARPVTFRSPSTRGIGLPTTLSRASWDQASPVWLSWTV